MKKDLSLLDKPIWD